MAVQAHIHLDSSLTGSPEYSPTLKWVAVDRLDIPEVMFSIERTLTGRLKTHVLTDTNGPVQFQNYRYTIRVQPDGVYSLEERVDLLKALDGHEVYLVDHFHPVDGVDHTANVRTMFLQVGEFPMTHGPGLPYFDVDIDLTDADTVA